MARPNFKLAGAALLALFGAVSCTSSKTTVPALTGPSDVGTSLQIQVIPDTIVQDGASQSLVTVTAFGPNGQPLRNLALRAEITVGGATTDFGSLSARNIVTDGSGRATVTYTAPPPPPIFVDNGIIVGISFTASGTDFGNSTPRLASIRLVPPGVIGAPPSPFRPDFVVPGATVGDSAVFSATVVDASGADQSNQIASYTWSFGDGDTASGRTVSHTFDDPGTFSVTLVIVDGLGRRATVSKAVTVAPGANPTAVFTPSPSAPNVNQAVNFNASASTATPGHRITDYSWDFGDGTSGGGVTTSHAYGTAGSYTVTLTVTDDAGRRGTATQTIAVGVGGPTATFTTSPSNPIVSQPINFNASQSRPVPGRSIVSYAWDFGDGTTGSGVQTTHAYAAVGTYVVTLTVTDSAGQTAFSTQSITVATDTPQARFTVTPGTPTAPSGTDTIVLLDASSSTAATGRTLVSYSWTVTGTGPHSNPPNASVTSLTLRAPGVYSIQLTVTDNVGKTSTTIQNITVTGT